MTSTSTSSVATAAAEHVGQGVDGGRPHRRAQPASPSSTRAATSRASIVPAARPVAAAYRSAMARAEATASSVVPLGDEDLADLAGAKRRPATDHAVDHDGGGQIPCRSRRTTRLRPLRRRRTSPRRVRRCARRGRPITGIAEALDEVLADGEVAPSHRHREASDSGARRRSRAPPPRRRRPPGRARSTRRRGRRRPRRCCPARLPGRARGRSAPVGGPELRPARGSPPSATYPRRRWRRRRGDRRSVTLACSASRTTLYVNDRGRSGSRPAMPGEFDRQSLGADQLDHRIEIVAHELSARGGDVVGQASRRLAEHPDDRSLPTHTDRTMAELHRRV